MIKLLVKETAIKNQILDYLKYKGIFCWLTNNQGNYNRFTNSYYKNPRLLKGISDIIGIMPDGRLLAIECKAEKGKLSEYQIEFLDNIKKNNGLAVVARDMVDVEKALLLLPYKPI